MTFYCDNNKYYIISLNMIYKINIIKTILLCLIAINQYIQLKIYILINYFYVIIILIHINKSSIFLVVSFMCKIFII